MSEQLLAAIALAENLREQDGADLTSDDVAILALYHELAKLRADKARLREKLADAILLADMINEIAIDDATYPDRIKAARAALAKEERL